MTKRLLHRPCRSLSFLLALLASLLFLQPLARGQTDTGRIAGTVTDQNGAIVPGAAVVVKNLKTGEERTAAAADNGAFIIAALRPSIYSILVNAQGLLAKVESVQLNVGQELNLSLMLQPVSIAASVDITAGGSELLVDTSSASMGANVNQREVGGLPLNGRQLSQLYLQAPGSVNSGSGTFGDIRFSGRAVEQNIVRYDGIEGSAIVDASPGNLNGEVPSLFRLQSSLENVQEFRVDSNNYPAEYGTGTGGQINVVTKSGGNRTVLRVGFGIYYGPGQTEDQIQPIESDRISSTLTSGPLLTFNPDQNAAVAALIANFNNNPNNRAFQPRAYASEYTLPEKVCQYSFSIQQELFSHTVLTAAYVGSQGHNLFLRSVANNLLPGQTVIADGTSLPDTFGVINRTNAAGQVIAVNTIREFSIVSGTSSVQNPFAEVDYKTSGGSDTYNALQLQLARRFATGMTLNAQYSFSRSYGNTAGSNEARTAANNARTIEEFEYDRSYNNFDVRRPSFVPGQPLYLDADRSFLNPAAFSTPLPSAFGDVPRNDLRGPNFRQVDLVLNKRIRLTERTNLEFRTEIFNLFNFTNFDVPASRLNLALPSVSFNAGTGFYTVGSGLQPGQAYTQQAAGGTFGLLRQTVERTVGLGTSRQIQFALRLNF